MVSLPFCQNTLAEKHSSIIVYYMHSLLFQFCCRCTWDSLCTVYCICMFNTLTVEADHNTLFWGFDVFWGWTCVAPLTCSTLHKMGRKDNVNTVHLNVWIQRQDGIFHFNGSCLNYKQYNYYCWRLICSTCYNAFILCVKLYKQWFLFINGIL